MSNSIQNDDFTLLVAAAGQGLRLGLGPKAFLRLGGKTLLEWVVEIGSGCIPRVVVAVPEGCIDRAREELSRFPDVQLVTGGPSRQASYRILLDACETRYVLIRDVCRPLATAGLIQRVAEAARIYGAAGAFESFVTPIAIGSDEFVRAVVPRADALVPSNPQAYTTEVLTQAVRSACDSGVETQTLWELLLLEDRDICIVEGEEANHKITTERDWAIMQQITFPRWLSEQTSKAGH